MANAIELQAELREDLGKGASRRLRREGKVPAVLYGGNVEPRAITLNHQELLLHIEHESFFAQVLNIKVGDKEQGAIVKDMQRHPSKRQVLHMDLQRIVAGETIQLTVPLHFVGEKDAPGVKLQGGVFSHLKNDVEISCLPKDLPEYIEVDVSKMELDDLLHLSDIPLPEGVEIPDLAPGDGYQDQPVVSLHRPHKVELDEDEEGAEGVEGEGEGAAPAPAADDGGSDD